MGGFWDRKSVVFGIVLFMIFACRSKIAPRASQERQRATQGRPRAAKWHQKGTLEAPVGGGRAPGIDPFRGAGGLCWVHFSINFGSKKRFENYNVFKSFWDVFGCEKGGFWEAKIHSRWAKLGSRLSKALYGFIGLHKALYGFIRLHMAF